MTSTDASSGREWAERPYYREEQRFPRWIKAVPLLVAVALGGALVPLWLAGPSPAPVGLVVALLFVLHLPLVALKGGEKLFIGSRRPAELVDAIARLKG